MGGFLKVVGALALIVIVVIVAFFAWGIMTIGPLIKGAQAYTDEAIPAIAAKWDREELVKRAAPDLKANLTPEGLDSVYAQFSSFGPLVKYDGSACLVTAMATTTGKSIVAKCIAQAKCENADIQAQVLLIQAGKSWLIDGILINKIVSSGPPATPGASVGIGTFEPQRGVRLPLNWLGSLGRSEAGAVGAPKP